MKAAVFTGPYEFKICDREKPKPGPKEVLIRIRAVGICGSDIHPYMGDGLDRREPGIIMGHEASGDVEEIGSEVTKWKPGDRVAINPQINDETCPMCRKGLPHLCDHSLLIGSSMRGFLDGAMCEYLIMHEKQLYHLPDEVSYDHGTFLDPLGNAIHLINRGGVKLGDVVVIIGAGTIGLLAIQTAKLAGAVKVIAEDGIQIRGIYERSDAKVRKQEGMELYKGFIGPEFPTLVEIVENGVKYQVDVKDGQKTGFFLDQKYNRLAIQKLCKDARVLDCFTHTGSFALNAGIAGAKEVTGVDASQLAVNQATENAKLNGLDDKVKFICEDVFELLPKLEEEGEKYDVVILDPPAFTKSRSSVKNAVKGYREINLRGLKLVKDGGFLATCSCSHFMEYELFTKTIGQAARSAHKRLRQVEYRTQAPDHPILWASDESYYLKFYIFQVCDEK